MATILIIDDDEALRGTMRRILERQGHGVLEAGDGREGMALFRERDPDVVITDLIMPGQEGIETILQLRTEYPGARVLAVSGGGRVAPGGPLSDAVEFGADASLAKPFSVEQLQQAVERLLAG